MGIPHVITSDQGSEFNNKVNAELMRSMGIDHRLTTAYHPQANGLDERFNQTLKNAIAKYSQDCRDKWDAKLGELVYAYNTSFQESTKHSPFEAMFGRVARLPIDCNMDNIDANQKVEVHGEARSPDAKERAAKRQKISEAVKHNIEKAQQKQQKKEKRWLPRFSMEDSLHDYCLPWQRIVSPERIEWRDGMHLCTKLLCDHTVHVFNWQREERLRR